MLRSLRWRAGHELVRATQAAPVWKMRAAQAFRIEQTDVPARPQSERYARATPYPQEVDQQTRQ